MTEEEQTPDAASTTTHRPVAASRRRHAAVGGRIMALGLSAGAAVAFTAAMANAVSPTGTAPVSDQQAPIVVHVVLAGGTTVDTTLTPAPTIAAAPVAAPASARSRAS